MSGQWRNARPDDDVLHVVPVADLIEHEVTEDCPCGPTPEVTIREGCSDFWVHTHHSLDGREARE